MNLVDLVKDIDYQESYDYEKRADLFNKYGTSTSTKFFIPIWGLAGFVREQIGNYRYRGYTDYGHGQRVLNSSISEIAKNPQIKEVSKERIVVTNRGHIVIWDYVPNVADHPTFGKRRKFVTFYKEGQISVSDHSFSAIPPMIRIPRDLYDKIDQYLLDHGYEKWIQQN